MITQADRDKLKRISELDYLKEIAQKLNKEGVKSRRSRPYNSRTLSRVFRGEQEDINAELAIFQYYDELDRKKAELAALKNKNINHPEPGKNQ